MSNIAIYPGSFDPCTNGHLDIIARSAPLFDKLYVAVLKNSDKKPLFSVDERIALLGKATAEIDNIEIISFGGLLVNIAEQVGARVIIKGLRAMSDFEYEFQMALANKGLNPNVETLFMTTNTDNSFLSSSLVKEIARNGGKISQFVPEAIEEEIAKKLY
ncbi:MAG: pantetheine-phosphate adenylyltransferase [Eubacteriales bacterium]|nr:pantetheine-phosphate adenylyltransferase [Eubacteriales bacterium]